MGDGAISDVLACTARWHVEQGDCLDVLRSMPDASVDAIVTDPPAGISFMGKAWDDDKGGRRQWIAWLEQRMREALRVLKPGGYALVWALPRTSHWTATALEDAGFEIRDSVEHLFATGFPKSLNVGDGRGTALKPAHEVWWLVRKPLAGTVAANLAEHGTGALNIDACRIGPRDRTDYGLGQAERTQGTAYGTPSVSANFDASKGRWPANVVLSHVSPDADGNGGCREVGTRRVATGVAVNRNRDPEAEKAAALYGTYRNGTTADATYASSDGTETVPAFECAPGCAVAALDAQSAADGMHSAGSTRAPNPTDGGGMWGLGGINSRVGDSGGASRFFFCAKPCTSETEAGCEHLPLRSAADCVDREESAAALACPRTGAGRSSGRRNYHPTKKSIDLMRQFCRLITPPDGVVLDLFAGSGSTGCAAVLEKLRFIGIELDLDEAGEPLGYVEIARARIAHWEMAPEARQQDLFATTASGSPATIDATQIALFGGSQ
jgi:DNA modification methylase